MDALLVEDIKDARERTAKKLLANGFDNVYQAASKKEALSVFRLRAHSINIAFLDYRLDENSESNRDGLDVAKYLKKFKPDLVTVGLSAYADDYPDHTSHVDYFIAKAIPKNHPNLTALTNESIAKIISEYESRRSLSLTDLPDRLLELKQKYMISDVDFRELIQLHPLTPSVEHALLTVQKQFSLDAEDQGQFRYEAEKQTIRLITPESDIGRSAALKNPLIIVVSKFEDCFISELYGLPTIYAYGDTEDESKLDLVQLLVEYKSELDGLPSKIKVKTDIFQFRFYLSELFGV